MADYGNTSQGGSNESRTVPWMEYVQKATNPAPGSKETVNTLMSMSKNKATVPDSRGGGDPDIGPSLMNNVTDGLSRSKIQDSPASNENDSYRSDGDMMQYPTEMNRPSIKDEPGQGRNWSYWGARNRPDEGAGSPWGSNLYGDGVNVSNVEASVKTAAKKLKQIIDESKHPKTEGFEERGKKLSPRLDKNDQDQATGLFTFIVPPGNKEPGKRPSTEHTVHVQFVRTSDTADSLLDHPVMVSCDCPSFLQWGPQYYALKGGYMYSPDFRPQNVSPRDPSMNGKGIGLTFCKHLYAVATHMGRMMIDPDHAEKINDEISNMIADPSILQLPDIREVEDKGDLQTFISDPEVHAEFQKAAVRHIEEHGLAEHELVDFVNGSLIPAKEEDVPELIKHMNPEIIILMLIEYRKIKGTVSSVIMNAVYPRIKAVLADQEEVP